MKFRGPLGYSDCEQDSGSSEHRAKPSNSITALDLCRTGLLSDQLGRISKRGCPGERRGPGELVDFHGSPTTSSRMVLTSMQRIKQRWQEVCMDKQEVSD